MKRGFLNTSKAKKALDGAEKEPNVMHGATLGASKPESNTTRAQPRYESAPYGVVENAGIPEGYKPFAGSNTFQDGRTVNYDDNQMITTTLPPENSSSTAKRDGSSQCCIYGWTKRHVLSMPGFPKAILRPSTIAHKIVEIPSKGLGIIANRDLQAGDLIFSERPIMVLPQQVQPIGHSRDSYANLSREQVMQAMMYEWEKHIIEPLFARAAPELREAFLTFQNCHKFDGSGPLMGIARTNAFAINLKHNNPAMSTDGVTYFSVVKDGSRFNHSCMPNVERIWDTVSFSLQFRAVCEVKAGEELTVAYCTLHDPAATRQKNLEPFGFQCTCKACQNPALSDRRRKDYYKKMPYPTEFSEWASSPSLPDDHLLKRCLEQLRVCDEEKLHLETATRGYLELVTQTYVYMADEKNALKYGTLLGRNILATTGEDGELKQLSQIEYHRTHPSWGFKKRPGVTTVSQQSG